MFIFIRMSSPEPNSSKSRSPFNELSYIYYCDGLFMPTYLSLSLGFHRDPHPPLKCRGIAPWWYKVTATWKDIKKGTFICCCWKWKLLCHVGSNLEISIQI